jgi:hypothetical protein
MFCFAVDDKDPENEAVPAMHGPEGWVPLMGSDIKRIESLMPIAQQLANQEGKPIRIYKFSVKEHVGEIQFRKEYDFI